MNRGNIVFSAMVALLMMSCGSGKNITKEGNVATPRSYRTNDNTLAFIQRVSDNAIYQRNVVSKIAFSLNTGSKEITVPGSIHMRKDDVIRLQLFVPILGSEVGRIEFTEEYVLIVDRLHKKYIKEDYRKVGFLRDKGLDFYTIQALFWNQLFIPGNKNVGESQLEEFSADINGGMGTVPVSLQQGNLSFEWTADRTSGLIYETDVIYKSRINGISSLKWEYSDFHAFGSKKYPYRQVLNLKTDVINQEKEVRIAFEMSGVSADGNWESRTAVSDKYTKVSAEEIIGQLINF